MNQYCILEPLGKVDQGDFYEFRVKTITGESFHSVNGFVDALANRLMQRYESQPVDDLLELDVALDSPDRTRKFYRRLFDEKKNGQYTQDFITVASETMGHWIEERLGQVLYAHSGIPHNSDPAYDILSIYFEDKTPRLRVVQVKATDSDLQHNCWVAIDNFGLLERGDYDAELSASLDLMLRQRNVPAGLVARELKLNRRYRVTIIHNQQREGVKIMTTYHEKVKGEADRRSGVLVKVDWPDLWEQVARKVYAQLA